MVTATFLRLFALSSIMSSQRYRITVTPIETNGSPCTGRCTIEFEQRSGENWMRSLETLQSQRRFSGDECAALTLSTQLLQELARQRGASPSALAAIQPELQALLNKLAAG